jgi:hypothetical protein
MEKFEDQQQEKRDESKKIIEGVIGKYEDNWPEKLPAGLKKEEVNLFLGHDGWHWHLKPEFIEDEQERSKYKEEMERW